MEKVDVETIRSTVLQISQDETQRAAFVADPVKVVEGILGVDLPDELVNAVIKAVKENLEGKDINDIIAAIQKNKGILDVIKGFFAKK
ncbi:MAG: hypothetical protein IJR45_04670 [Firmicutes bacterium]|nr:hypothetical protein [Bacillota bacterium]MBQ9604690.1 hypothetical protein [Bacillota bacterium]